MKLTDLMAQEFEQEAASTRKVLERITEEKFDFKPHEKSMTLGKLASHIAESQGWTKPTLELNELDVSDFKPLDSKSKDEILSVFDKGVAESLAAFKKGTSNEALMENWKLVANGQTMFEAPRGAVLRMFVLSHMVHHRAQLGVYLRMNDIPVPGIYGPSADEQ